MRSAGRKTRFQPASTWEETKKPGGMMRKSWMILGLLVGALVFVTGGLANNGHGHGNSHHKFGPYDVVTDDHGSCGNPWAVDTEKRIYKVTRNHDGSYTLLRRDRGTFLTNEGPSPGACETRGRHGQTVPAGKHGKFHGFLRGTITGGTFDPNATCPADCGFTDVFIATFFGPNATFSCFEDSRACAFDYEYSAPSQGLRWHHWSDKGKGAGTFLHERFHGDIASPSKDLSLPDGAVGKARLNRRAFLVECDSWTHEPAAANSARLGARSLRADRAQARDRDRHEQPRVALRGRTFRDRPRCGAAHVRGRRSCRPAGGPQASVRPRQGRAPGRPGRGRAARRREPGDRLACAVAAHRPREWPGRPSLVRVRRPRRRDRHRRRAGVRLVPSRATVRQPRAAGERASLRERPRRLDRRPARAGRRARGP